ncbi:ROK family protein [Algirhabdus cladophorae]|uniref:ROK family protein n=1 Tax=Algirhabdus cladophorae TaxID=3377108 RepID=UPI003B846638
MAFLSGIHTTEGLRHRNRALVLASLRALGPASHTQIAEHCGLASSTITVITSEFLAEGVIEKVQQPAASGRGRPRVLLGLRSTFGYFAFIRISSGMVEFSLMDYRRVLMDRRSFHRDPQQTSAKTFGLGLRQQLVDFIARSKLLPADIKSIMITSKGLVDPDTARLLWSPVFADEPLDFARLFRTDWPASVILLNETCLSAHQVIHRSDDMVQGARHAVLSLGDSIGLGVATLRDGGEIEMEAPAFGHLPHQFDGPLCRCGAQGCLETYAGFYGILRAAFDAPAHVIPAKFIPLDEMNKIAVAARAGDRRHIFAFRQAGQALGLSLARLFSLMGPMPVHISGPGVAFYDLLQADVEAMLDQSLQVRLGQRPQLDLLSDERALVFESAAEVVFRRYDTERVAVRRADAATGD